MTSSSVLQGRRSPCAPALLSELTSPPCISLCQSFRGRAPPWPACRGINPPCGRVTKPFWGTDETGRKQMGTKCSPKQGGGKAPGGCHEPLNSLSGPCDPPENRGRCSCGRHRGRRFGHLGAHQLRLQPDRSRDQGRKTDGG